MTYVEKRPDPSGLPETTEELAPWINEEHRRCEADAERIEEYRQALLGAWKKLGRSS